jgi:transcriptional regulator with XRE-family HTH domain
MIMDFNVEFYETETGACPGAMKKMNFDKYLDEQLKDRSFAARFERAGEAWDVALQIAALRQQAGLSQKDLAKLLKISQQQISRLESPGYEGHSLSTLRRVDKVLHARVKVTFEPEKKGAGMRVAETAAPYRTKRSIRRRARPKQGMSR